MPAATYTAIRHRRQQRAAKLSALGFASYADYLNSAQWRTVRQRYFASDLPQDCMCGASENLQLHHLTYERAGAEQLTDLTPLCAQCHVMIHTLERRGDIGLDLTGFVSEKRAARYAEERPCEADAAPAHPPTLAARVSVLTRHPRYVGRQLARIEQDVRRAERILGWA